MLRTAVTRIYVAALPDGGRGTEPPGTVGPKLNVLFGWIVYLALAACVAGLIFALVKLAISHRNQEDFNGGGIIKSLIAAIFIVGSTGLVTGVIG